MKFKYLRDPLFLFCSALYLLNRWILKPNFQCFFLHFYLNDVICIPLLVPPMLFAARYLRIRADDQFPRTHEIYIPVIVWAVMYEIILPSSPWRQFTHADPYDVMAYVVGAILASQVWEFNYASRVKPEIAVSHDEKTVP